ncbi:MAG: hypothetical protein IPM45_14425 [Acidimicrobiales bacterium]|nr:hypothetical protein [Acidimicrobiales bacterium]
MPVLAGVAAACFASSLGLVYAAWRVAGRVLALRFLVACLWFVYFPLRLLVLQSDRSSPYVHPIVRSSTDADLVWAWLVSTLGLAALVLGGWVVQRVRFPSPRPRAKLLRADYVLFAVIGLAIGVALPLLGATSGFLSNVAQLALFGTAGLVFIDVRARRVRLASVVVLVVALLLGAASSFKEATVLPVVAWGIGALAATGKVRTRLLVLLGIVALVGYLGVEGRRIAYQAGESPDLLTAAWRAATAYDLRIGRPTDAPFSGLDAVGNVARGISRRVSGPESLLLLREKVPDEIPFQRGRSLVQPALSIVPGIERVIPLEYRQLSLGRYFTVNFWSLQPREDPSSQALTVPGDGYLNFGLFGLVGVSMMFGLAIGLYDRRYPPDDAFGVAMFAFAGLVALGIERNVAYVLVTLVIRVGVAELLAGLGSLRVRGRSIGSAGPERGSPPSTLAPDPMGRR